MASKLVHGLVFTLALFSQCSSLTGCATTKGPTAIVSAQGVFVTEDDKGLAKRFFAAEKSAASTPSPETAAAMLEQGFTLIYANCSDFFATAGETQKWLIVSRDTIGAVGTLATAVLALHNGSKNAISNVALATSTAFTGIDIYTKNFLFSAENVDAVRTLILKALSVHQDAVRTTGAVSYESATMHLMDDQNICLPMSITALAKAAIKGGNVVASKDPADELANVAQMQDQQVLQRLGKLLNPPGALSLKQAGALWWLLIGGATAEEQTTIKALLVDLPAESSPFDAEGNVITDWTFTDQVTNLLAQFSKSTRSAFAEAAAPASSDSEKAFSDLADTQRRGRVLESRPSMGHVTVSIE